MKKTSLFLAVAIASLGVSPAIAAEHPTVAIIDSGFDTSLIDNVIAEACIVTISYGCNNGKLVDESTGASGTPIKIMKNWKSEWSHGSKMAGVVNQINPNANLVLIRNALVLKSGAVNIGGDKEFEAALEWVIANKDKYNITAVSFSRASNRYTKKGICPVNKPIQEKIISLQNLGVPTIIAAGNNADKVNVSYPACIPEAVAISGIYSSSYTPNVWSSYRQTFGTNSGVLTDFYAYGNFKTRAGLVAESTSSSTAAFAGYWSKVSNGNYFETYKNISLKAGQKFVNVLQ